MHAKGKAIKKKIVVIAVCVALVISVIAAVVYEFRPQKPFTVWTDLKYAGATPAGFNNFTIPGYDGYEADNLTFYNYTFTVNTNTLTVMSIHDHCAAIIPHWSDFSIAFTYDKVNSTCWNFNIGIKEIGPAYLISQRWGNGQTQGPSLPPLAQEEINAINADLRSQNT